MKVKLVSVSESLIEGINSPEELMVYCARVSNPDNQLNTATGEKLLKYCLDNKHFSIFEMADLTVEITTSRAISAQILRHKSFSFQEFCISGDSLVTTVTEKGRSKKVKIKDLYKRYKSNYWSRSDQLVRIYDESTKLLKSAKIKEVFYTGLKETYKLTLEDGSHIVSTLDHKFLTNKGFITLKECDTDTFIGRNGMKDSQPRYVKVKSIEYVGLEETYDMEIDHESHNYVANGIITHNSQRYSKSTNFQYYQARSQDLKNRQNSIDNLSREDKAWFLQAQKVVTDLSNSLYNEALDKGIAKEQARFLLPLNTETTIYMKGNIRSWIHYLDLRMANGTQKEHADIAKAICEIFKTQFPLTAKAKGW